MLKLFNTLAVYCKIRTVSSFPLDTCYFLHRFLVIGRWNYCKTIAKRAVWFENYNILFWRLNKWFSSYFFSWAALPRKVVMVLFSHINLKYRTFSLLWWYFFLTYNKVRGGWSYISILPSYDGTFSSLTITTITPRALWRGFWWEPNLPVQWRLHHP